MIAALALFAVPATLYMTNPEFTCGECDESGGEDYEEYPEKEEEEAVEETPSSSSTEQTPDPREEIKQRHERLIQAANDFLRQEEPAPRVSEAPKVKPVQPDTLKSKVPVVEPAKSKHAPAATAPYVPSPVAPSVPAQAPAPRKAEDAPAPSTRTAERSEPVPAPRPAPTATNSTPTRPEAPANERAPNTKSPAVENVTPPKGSVYHSGKKEDSHPRSNSAYRLRVEHQQQQVFLQQQHEEYLQQLQNIRTSSPQKVKPPSTAESAPVAAVAAPPQAAQAAPAGRSSAPLRGRVEPQQFETLAPRHREHQSSAPPMAAASSAPVSAVPTKDQSAPTKVVTPEVAPIHVPARSVRLPSPTSIGSHRTSPLAPNLPPLPPRRREDNSPVTQNQAPSGTTPPVMPTPIAAAVASAPAPVNASASAYLTPKEKQARALAELRKHEDAQRNAAKIMIQEELQRALDELHEQEALQREQEQNERSKILEEQRRRELIQQSILEEKLRIERDEEVRRGERRKLQEQQEQQKAAEESQRLADQRAMNDLIVEVERDRAEEQKRFQEEQLARVERMLQEEEQRQQEILEQLRLQNQYPYPRGHPRSNVPASGSASPSPGVSPAITPNGSMRVQAGERAAAMTPETPASAGKPASSGRPSNIPRAASPSPYHKAPGSAGRNSLGSSSRDSAPDTPYAQEREVTVTRLQTREEVTTMEHTSHHHHYAEHTYASAGKTATHAAPTSRFSLGSPTATTSPSATSTPAVATASPGTAPKSANGTPSATASAAAAAALAASVNKSAGLRRSPEKVPSMDENEDNLLPEEVELRVLHAREDLALKVDYYIRTQKKFSSAVPLKYKCAVSKVVSDCEKYRRAYNQEVGEEAFKIHSLMAFLESHPRFSITGGKQMVGVTFLTPYQASDNRRVYGMFKCSKCIKYWMEGGVNKSDYRSWENAYSYKDCYQQCYQCDVQVYPFHQRFLKKTELNFDDRAKHDVTRCSKCEQNKRPCYEL